MGCARIPDALRFSSVAEVFFMTSRTGKYTAAAIALSLTLVSVGLARLRPAFGADGNTQNQPMQMDMPGPAGLGIPSYHAYALKPPFPATLDPKQFPDALNRNVYALAAKIRPVLYQQPCYCYCDRHAGHKSLLDCFVSAHGSECDICQKEAVLSYQLTQKGKTPAQIRAAIIRGDWRPVNLNPYMSAASPR
jgi:uncharacterized protein with PCYCGC motif